MKIAVIFASHRLEGKSKEIETSIVKSNFNHLFDFIRLAEMNITPTLTQKTLSDDFDCILQRLIDAEILLLAIPVYCPYPSKFTALMERLLDVSYLNPNKPLAGKPVAIVYYCSTKICDETPIRLLFQKYLMDDYRFDAPNYNNYLNNEQNPNEKYDCDVVKYVLDIIKKV